MGLKSRNTNKMTNSKVAISIIIVNYKTPQLLLECVRSIVDTTKELSYEIVIVDNNSEDESEYLVSSKFPNVKWINSGYNAGFARANNLGIKKSTGEFIFLLNPDALLSNGYLAKMINYYELLSKTNKVGLLTARILSSVDNSLLVGTGIGFAGIKKEWKKNPLSLKWRKIFKRKNKEGVYHAETMHYKNHEVDFVSGACTLIKRATLENLNLYMDEDFFLYWEDVEWSYRVKKYGLKNFFFADAEIFHVNSASTGSLIHRNAQVRISEFLFYSKRYHKLSFHLLGILMRLNYFLTSLLLKRNEDEASLAELNFDKLLFKQYYYQGYEHYCGKTKNERPYLKYVEETIK
jgi:GT2 family glycosyltransferase